MEWLTGALQAEIRGKFVQSLAVQRFERVDIWAVVVDRSTTQHAQAKETDFYDLSCGPFLDGVGDGHLLSTPGASRRDCLTS